MTPTDVVISFFERVYNQRDAPGKQALNISYEALRRDQWVTS